MESELIYSSFSCENKIRYFFYWFDFWEDNKMKKNGNSWQLLVI